MDISTYLLRRNFWNLALPLCVRAGSVPPVPPADQDGVPDCEGTVPPGNDNDFFYKDFFYTGFFYIDAGQAPLPLVQLQGGLHTRGLQLLADWGQSAPHLDPKSYIAPWYNVKDGVNACFMYPFLFDS